MPLIEEAVTRALAAAAMVGGSFAISGARVDVQTIWLGPTAPPPCPPIGLSASNALELTVQP